MQTISIPYDNSKEVFHIFATYGGKGRSSLTEQHRSMQLFLSKLICSNGVQ